MSLTIQERIKDLRGEGITAMQIQNWNAWVDVARAEIVEKYQPGENDKNCIPCVSESNYTKSSGRSGKAVIK